VQFDKKTWMSLFIAVIMIVSVIGFALSFHQPPETLKYRGTTFVRTQQGLQATIDGMRLYFYNFPGYLEDIPVSEEAKAPLENARVLWFSYNPQDEHASEIADAMFYLEEALAAVKDRYVQRGFINNTDYALPEITCANSTAAVPVLIMQSGNETAITAENNCIIATATSRAAVYQIGDRILYQATGVMQ
jgi:hypothetical protein